MMKSTLAIALSVLVVSACAPEGMQGTNISEFNRMYKEWLAKIDKDQEAMERYPDTLHDNLTAIVKRSPIDCQLSAWKAALDTVGEMEAVADDRWRLVNDNSALYQVRSTRDLNLKLHRQNVETSIAARFGIADTALKHGCIDIADENYRHIFKVYTGSLYNAHRERAKIGIDDVREKRRG